MAGDQEASLTSKLGHTDWSASAAAEPVRSRNSVQTTNLLQKKGRRHFNASIQQKYQGLNMGEGGENMFSIVANNRFLAFFWAEEAFEIWALILLVQSASNK